MHKDDAPKEIAIRKARFTEHHVIAVLKTVEADRIEKNVCCEAGISEAIDIKKSKDL